jgi:hypothetical protein
VRQTHDVDELRVEEDLAVVGKLDAGDVRILVEELLEVGCPEEAAADGSTENATDTKTNGKAADISTKVKSTVMPIDNKAKSAASPTPAVKKPEPKDPDGRTRRVQPKPE